MRHALLVVLLLSSSSCVEKSQGLTRTEREQLREFVSETPTSPEHELDVSFEDKVILVGYDVSSDNVAPGGTLTITWHWRVERALEDGWKIFTHVTDDRGGNQLNEDENGTVRQLYQPGQWKTGEYIRDTQEIVIPDDWGGRRAVAYVGLWNGPNRMRVLRGPSDGDNRARGATVQIGAAPAQPAEPTTPRLDAMPAQNIELDGLLNEPSWASASWTNAFVDTLSGDAAAFQAKAKLLWDDQNLYVAFEVADDYLKSEFTNHDDHLWEADCVEIMVDPDGDGRNYFELQVSPRNVSFDTRYDSRRQPQPIGHDDWDSGLRSGVNVRGDVDDDDDGDEGYTVEIAIPWSAFDAGASPAAAPSAGDMWRLNFYVMDSREDDQRANGWSPPRVGDFHVPARFGRVRFVDPTAAAAPRPTNPSGMIPIVVPTGLQQQLQGHLRSTARRNHEREEQDRPQLGESAGMTAMTAME